jgi:protoheme IX farnesyltransferase
MNTPLKSRSSHQKDPYGAASADLGVGLPADDVLLLRQRLLDFVELTKPRITLLCLMMFVGGYYYSLLVSGSLISARGLFHRDLFWGLIGTWAAVAAANTLNMVSERRSDRLMARTLRRPLPSGRMKTAEAAVFGASLAVLSAYALWQVNVITLILGLLALWGYVCVYTPLKRVTPQALIIGAVPGALPPLMGWTAHHGALHPVGLVLFGVLVFWQVPHFIAIAVTHKEDYARAGIRVLPLVAGDTRAVTEALIYSVVLLVVSLLLIPLAHAGWVYGVTATLLGLWMIVLSAKGYADSGRHWARRLFLASLVYLPVLTSVLVLEVLYTSRIALFRWSL